MGSGRRKPASTRRGDDCNGCETAPGGQNGAALPQRSAGAETGRALRKLGGLLGGRLTGCLLGGCDGGCGLLGCILPGGCLAGLLGALLGGGITTRGTCTRSGCAPASGNSMRTSIATEDEASPSEANNLWTSASNARGLRPPTSARRTTGLAGLRSSRDGLIASRRKRNCSRVVG